MWMFVRLEGKGKFHLDHDLIPIVNILAMSLSFALIQAFRYFGWEDVLVRNVGSSS